VVACVDFRVSISWASDKNRGSGVLDLVTHATCLPPLLGWGTSGLYLWLPCIQVSISVLTIRIYLFLHSLHS